jgi:hypothetical protein
MLELYHSTVLIIVKCLIIFLYSITILWIHYSSLFLCYVMGSWVSRPSGWRDSRWQAVAELCMRKWRVTSVYFYCFYFGLYRLISVAFVSHQEDVTLISLSCICWIYAMFWIISIVGLFLMMKLPYENMLDFYIWIIMEIFMSYTSGDAC